MLKYVHNHTKHVPAPHETVKVKAIIKINLNIFKNVHF